MSVMRHDKEIDVLYRDLEFSFFFSRSIPSSSFRFPAKQMTLDRLLMDTPI